MISPFVSPKTVFDGLLDHTLVLKFIAQKFGGGNPYSDLVNNRPVGVLNVLNLDAPRTEIPVVQPLIGYLNKQVVWCRWSDSNRHDFLRSQDFKSCASAISPHRQHGN